MGVSVVCCLWVDFCFSLFSLGCLFNHTMHVFLAGRKMGGFFHLKLQLHIRPNFGEWICVGESSFPILTFFLANISSC